MLHLVVAHFARFDNLFHQCYSDSRQYLTTNIICTYGSLNRVKFSKCIQLHISCPIQPENANHPCSSLVQTNGIPWKNSHSVNLWETFNCVHWIEFSHSSGPKWNVTYVINKNQTTSRQKQIIHWLTLLILLIRNYLESIHAPGKHKLNIRGSAE